MRSSDSTGKSGGHARRSADGSAADEEKSRSVLRLTRLLKNPFSFLSPRPTPRGSPRCCRHYPAPSGPRLPPATAPPQPSARIRTPTCTTPKAPSVGRCHACVAGGGGTHHRGPRPSAARTCTTVGSDCASKQRACSVRDKPVSDHKNEDDGLGVFFTWIQEKSSSIFPPWISDHIRVVTGVSAHSRLCSIAS